MLEAVSLILVGHIPAPRAVRIEVPGAHVRFEKAVADLANLSVTGALVHAGWQIPVGSEWRIVVELPSETIPLTARVVSCNSSTSSSAGSVVLPAAYAIALAFVGASAGARRALQRVVQQAYRS